MARIASRAGFLGGLLGGLRMMESSHGERPIRQGRFWGVSRGWLAVVALGLGTGCGTPVIRSDMRGRMDSVVSSPVDGIHEPAAFPAERLNGGTAVAGLQGSTGSGKTWNGWKVPPVKETGGAGLVQNVEAAVVKEPKVEAPAELAVLPVEGTETSDPLLRACRETRIELPKVGKAADGMGMGAEGLPELPKETPTGPGELPRNLSAEAERLPPLDDPLMEACRAAKIPPPVMIR